MKNLKNYINESLINKSLIAEYQTNPELLKSKWEHVAEMFQSIFNANDWNSIVSKKAYMYATYSAPNKLVRIMEMFASEEMLLKFNCEKTTENLENIAQAYIVHIQNKNS